MWLNIIWFVLYVVIIGGYVILDGFDLGVGMLPPLRREGRPRAADLAQRHRPGLGRQRGLARHSAAARCSPPSRWCTPRSSPGFYLALMLAAGRADPPRRRHRVPLEAREPRWRGTWDWFFFGSSLGITLLLGVALGQRHPRGAARPARATWTSHLVDLLNPYSLFVGITAVAMLCLHGCDLPDPQGRG